MSSVTRRHFMYIFTVIGRINLGTQFTKSLGDILVLFPLFILSVFWAKIGTFD